MTERSRGPGCAGDYFRTVLDLEWALDGRRLFFTSDSYQTAQTTIGEYQIASRELHLTTTAFGGGITGMTVDERTPERLLRATLGRASACPPPIVYPSGRTGPCGGFSF